ncbi:sensor histidine kinase [Nocardioides sp.]|uniref:sensor histidine kinase n=1 Tax=Nocardioides sp. TaxID=35761 RepID=UPI00271FC5CC|nr:histidine kinase [Nocardioides sp.]MDO9457878.1 histidine kinase [Nocardioides sp.]
MRLLPDRTWARPGPTAEQRRHDVVLGLVAAVVFVASAELLHSAYGFDRGIADVEAFVLLGVAGLVLAGRRRFPLTTMLVQSGLFILVGERLAEYGAAFTVQMAMFAVVYAAWAWSDRPRALLASTLVVLVAMFGWLVVALLEDGVLPPGRVGLVDAGVAAFAYSLAINIVYFGGAIAWGQAAWSSARRRVLLEAQQERERAARSLEQERAVHDERVRIARDLHDVVAHHISGIGVQAAGAGRVLERDPGAAREALSTIESSSRRAVAQMHQLVGLLRASGEDLGRTPQPGLADVATLAGGVRPEVEHRVVGEPFAVPETVGLSLFRVAQEAVTNARRHAHARHASVVVRYVDEPHAVEVEVLDDGRSESAHQGSGGYGLRGIRERAALHDGEAEIGPRPQGGGWRVRVRVPVDA